MGVSEREFPNKLLTFDKVQFYKHMTLFGITFTYLEELILSSLESSALLTIVHKDSSIVYDRHLSKALLRIQKHVEYREHAYADESCYYDVVVLH